MGGGGEGVALRVCARRLAEELGYLWLWLYRKASAQAKERNVLHDKRPPGEILVGRPRSLRSWKTLARETQQKLRGQGERGWGPG